MFHQFITDRLTRTVMLGVGLLLFLCFQLIAIPSPTAAQDATLLEDTFTDNSNNWKLASKTGSTFDIGDGALTIGLTQDNLVSWATPNLVFPDDLTVEVETTTLEPGDGGDWSTAVIIRANTRDLSSGFYQFEVTGTGNWAFVTRTAKGDEYKSQRDGKLKNFDPTAANKLQVVASGTTFTFSVNGTRVGVFEDDSINNDPSTKKYIGLLAGTFKGTNSVKVEFRNLVITGEGTADPGTDEATPTPTKPARTPTKPGRTPTKPPVKPTATATKAANNGGSGDELIQETFADDNPNDWTTGSTKDSAVSIKDGALVIQVLSKDYMRWSSPRAVKFPADVDIIVTAKTINPDPSGDWSYGVGARYSFTGGGKRYLYFFEVTGTGEWDFAKFDGSDKIQTIVKWKKITGSFNPKAANELRMVARGSHFEFYLNGKKLGEADDDSIVGDQSSIVLLASTLTKASKVTVNFIDLMVLPAPPQ